MINSISLGMMSQFTAVFTRLLRIGIYTWVYVHVSVVPLDAAKAFWQTWYGWVLALIFYDLCDYWLHRLGHESAILWAAHCWAGCSTYPWPLQACRLWCLAPWR